MMTPILWRLAIAATLFMAGFGGGVVVTRNHYLPIIADMKLKEAVERQKASEAVTKAVQDNDLLKSTLEKQHAQANDALNVILGVHAPRVQMPRTACPESNPPLAASGSASSVAGNGILQPDPQIALDEFTKQLEQEAAYADTMIENCRVLKLWSLEQGK